MLTTLEHLLTVGCGCYHKGDLVVVFVLKVRWEAFVIVCLQLLVLPLLCTHVSLFLMLRYLVCFLELLFRLFGAGLRIRELDFECDCDRN